jgi:hypothetical protein
LEKKRKIVNGKLLNHIGWLSGIFFGFIFEQKPLASKSSFSLSHLPKQNISPF